MSEQQETIFTKGMFFNSKHANAPEFVLGSISFKVDEFIEFLQKYKKEDGYVNVDFLRARPKEGETKGKPYFKLNTYKPEKKDAPVNAGEDDREVPPLDDSEIPF